MIHYRPYVTDYRPVFNAIYAPEVADTVVRAQARGIYGKRAFQLILVFDDAKGRDAARTIIRTEGIGIEDIRAWVEEQRRIAVLSSHNSIHNSLDL